MSAKLKVYNEQETEYKLLQEFCRYMNNYCSDYNFFLGPRYWTAIQERSIQQSWSWMKT